MPDTSDIEYKAQQSIINWLKASTTHSIVTGIAAGNHHHGDTQTDETKPCIVVAAQVQEEHLKDSGHYRLGCEVRLRWQIDETSEATARGYWEKVRSIMNWDALAARLSDLSGFHCWIVIRDQGESIITEDRHRERIYGFTMICMAMDNS